MDKGTGYAGFEHRPRQKVKRVWEQEREGRGINQRGTEDTEEGTVSIAIPIATNMPWSLSLSVSLSKV